MFGYAHDYAERQGEFAGGPQIRPVCLYSEDHTKIRANQRYSLQVDVELTASLPSQYLFHGTATRFLAKNQRESIQKIGRQYVHLSRDIETAAAVGRRHGTPVVIRIDAEAVAWDRITFYRSENGV